MRLEVVDFISTSGHAAEAVELLELRLKEAPDEDFAGDLHGAAIERAYATACADETAARERAAVHRFADRTGLVAFKDAVSAFLDGTELGEAVRARVTEELSVTDDVDWSPEDRVAFGKLAEEISWLTVDPGQDEDETPPRSGPTRRRTSPGRPSSAPPRAALRLRPKAGRNSGSMSRFLRCSAEHPGRPHEAGSGRTWRRCCGSSSTRPTSWPPMARLASTPPGSAGNSTCQAISPTERPDNRPALVTAHSLLQPALAVR